MTGAFGADDIATLPRLMFRKLRFLMIADNRPSLREIARQLYRSVCQLQPPIRAPD